MIHRLAEQAAIGLNVLHSSIPSVIHRDLKSLNYMVSMDGNAVKLIDFGMSKVSSASSRSVSTAPREGILLFFSPLFSVILPSQRYLKLIFVCLALGTIRWGAPETFDYPALWTDKADIYSLGMTFWEIASRKVPFEDVSPPHFTIRTPPPSPSLFVFSFPALSTWILDASY